MKSKTSIKKTILVIFIIGLIVSVLTFGALCFSARTFSIYMKESPDGYSDITAEYSSDGIVEMVGAQKEGDFWKVTFRALKPGSTEVKVLFSHSGEEYELLQDTYHDMLFVTPVKTIFEPSNLNFNGFYYLCSGISLFFFCAGFYLLHNFRMKNRTDFFKYETVLNLGIGLFMLVFAFLFLGLMIFSVVAHDISNGRNAFLALQYATSVIAVVSLPFILLLSALLVISNFWLIRHEGMRKTNILGIILAFFLVFGIGVCAVAALYNTQLFYFEPKSIVVSSGRTIISTLYLYFYTIFIATQYCCIIAARRKPDYDADAIIILGCAIKKDGTLYPLIKGRADRAIEFFRDQTKISLKTPIFIPSGGQGSDEVISEGEAVKRYLVEQGIDESLIKVEDKSANTLQNMAFSRKIAEEEVENPKVVFSTTNYHVFRSGIFANQVFENADGISSKTKWYFWPNAQIREFIGLLSRSVKLNIVVSLILVVFSLLISNLGSVIDHIFS